MDAENQGSLVKEYEAIGWKNVPVDREERHPNRKGWPTTNYSTEYILEGMSRGHGVGIQTGPASNHLVCVDNDSHYARVCAPDFLPRTLWTGKENEAGGLL